ncbi:MAG: cupin domain-containing protein [Caldilineaceae bacterium]|nr:cupin domain-containing protein [Caldilineaceae bacterium]
MGFPVYDFRTDVRNILVTPQIRSRFLRMEPGQVSQGHTHDLGHEIFLILSGRCEFTIDGESEVLGPGQMCVALVDQMHSVRVMGDEPMTMYLSVTPHIQPTHTFWDKDGNKLPPRFSLHSAYDIAVDTSMTNDELLQQHVGAAQSVAATAQTFAQVQAEQAAVYRQAIGSGDVAAATAARAAMWEVLSALHSQLFSLDDNWNELAPRLIDGKPA